MTGRARALLVPIIALVMAGSGAAVVTTPQVAQAESCSLSMTPDLKTAKGILFTGTYLGKRWDGEIGRRVRAFDVRRVFAGGDAVAASTLPAVLSEGQVATFSQGGCSVMLGLRPGHRYLMSVSWLGPLTAWYGVAWELLPGGRVQLVVEYDGARMDPRLAGPSTLREVVALMRPTAEPRYRGIPIDRLTGTCPDPPATPHVLVDPSADPTAATSPTTSASGLAWDLVLQASGPIPFDAPCSFDAVTAWSGGFIASAHDGARAGRRLTASWTSLDGRTWTRHDPVDAATAGQQSGPTLAYGDGLLRFGDDDGSLAVWSSDDGETWSRQPAIRAFRSPASWLELRAAVSGARVMVTGTYRDRCDVLGCRERTWAWTSPEGATWTRTGPDGRIQPRPVHPIVGVADGFIALGDQRTILVSTDGANWSVGGALPDDLLLTGVFATIPGDPGTYWVTLRNIDVTWGTVVVSVHRSDDLRTWTEVVRSPGTHSWPPVMATGPSGIVVAGLDDDEVPWAMSSADGVTWSLAPPLPDLALGTPAAAAVGAEAAVIVSRGQNLSGALIWTAQVEADGRGP